MNRIYNDEISFTEEELNKIENNLGWRFSAMNQKTQQQGLTKVDTIRGLLEKMKPEIQKVLPKHLDPARIIRMALTDFQTVKHLNECTQESFLGALMECSQLGLEPGRMLGHAYLLPFRNKQGQYICKLIPGYQGLCVLARRSGEIRTIEPRLVRTNDFFDYEFGLTPFCKHKPAKSGRGEITHSYVVATLSTGEKQFDVMETEEIEQIRSEHSQSGDSLAWTNLNDKGEMYKKTVLKRLCKSLPSSVELRTALQMDVHEDEIQQESVVEDDWGVLPSKQEIKSFSKKKFPPPGTMEQGQNGIMNVYGVSNMASQDNDLLDVRVRIDDALGLLARSNAEWKDKMIEASTVERDGGKFWLTIDQIGSCTDLNWLRQTAEKLEKMVEG